MDTNTTNQTKLHVRWMNRVYVLVIVYSDGHWPTHIEAWDTSADVIMRYARTLQRNNQWKIYDVAEKDMDRHLAGLPPVPLDYTDLSDIAWTAPEYKPLQLNYTEA